MEKPTPPEETSLANDWEETMWRDNLGNVADLETIWLEFASHQPLLARKILSQTEASRPPRMHIRAWLREKARRIRLAVFLYHALFSHSTPKKDPPTISEKSADEP